MSLSVATIISFQNDIAHKPAAQTHSPAEVEQHVTGDGVVTTQTIVEIHAGARTVERDVAVKYGMK